VNQFAFTTGPEGSTAVAASWISVYEAQPSRAWMTSGIWRGKLGQEAEKESANRFWPLHLSAVALCWDLFCFGAKMPQSDK